MSREVKILAEMSPTTLHKTTKCLKPCKYTEYRLAGDREKDEEKGIKLVKISLSDSKATLMYERKLYGWTSFIAEFGGALGLFVGFSFLTLFDLYELVLKFMPKLPKLK